MKKPYNVFERVQRLAMQAKAAFPFGSDQTGNPDPKLAKMPTPQADLDGRGRQGPFNNVRPHSRHALLIKDTTVDTGQKIKGSR